MLVRECEYFIKVTNDSSTGPRFGIFADGYEVAGLSARLIGVPFPSSRLFREESFDGVRWISCLSSTNPEHRYSTHPWKLERLDSVQLDSPLGGTLSTKRALLSLALRIQRKLRDGEGVLVHCDMGIERTGAVLGTVLALEGFDPQRVACGIADAVEAQQPEWAGPRFPDDLAICIGKCLALRQSANG